MKRTNIIFLYLLTASSNIAGRYPYLTRYSYIYTKISTVINPFERYNDNNFFVSRISKKLSVHCQKSLINYNKLQNFIWLVKNVGVAVILEKIKEIKFYFGKSLLWSSMNTKFLNCLNLLTTANKHSVSSKINEKEITRIKIL